MVRQQTLTLLFVGSSPTIPANRLGDRPRGVVSDKGEDAHPYEVETVRHKVGSVAKQPWVAVADVLVARSTNSHWAEYHPLVREGQGFVIVEHTDHLKIH